MVGAISIIYRQGSFSRLYKDGFKTYKVLLSDSEKESIDSLFKANNFQSFPPEFEVLLVVVDMTGIICLFFETSIEICKDGTCKKVALDFANLDKPIYPNEDKALEYEKLYFEI